MATGGLQPEKLIEGSDIKSADELQAEVENRTQELQTAKRAVCKVLLRQGTGYRFRQIGTGFLFRGGEVAYRG